MDSETSKKLAWGLLGLGIILGGTAIVLSKKKETGLVIEFTTTMTETWGEITFTEVVSGDTVPYDLVWDFGDGVTSVGSRPTHIYTAVGTYIITLTIIDADGVSKTVIHSLTLTETGVEEETGDLIAKMMSDNDGLTVHFEAIARGGIAPYTYNWSLGDGTTSTETKFDHTYTPNQGGATVSPDDWVLDDLGVLPHPQYYDTGTITWADGIAPYVVGLDKNSVSEFDRKIFVDNTTRTGRVFGWITAEESYTWDQFTDSDFMVMVFIILVGFGQSIVWSGLGQVKNLLEHTFAGTVTLTVTDSVGVTKSISQDISIADQAASETK